MPFGVFPHTFQHGLYVSAVYAQLSPGFADGGECAPVSVRIDGDHRNLALFVLSAASGERVGIQAVCYGMVIILDARYPFKVGGIVVLLVCVDVVYIGLIVWIGNKSYGNKAVYPSCDTPPIICGDYCPHIALFIGSGLEDFCCTGTPVIKPTESAFVADLVVAYSLNHFPDFHGVTSLGTDSWNRTNVNGVKVRCLTIRLYLRISPAEFHGAASSDLITVRLLTGCPIWKGDL